MSTVQPSRTEREIVAHVREREPLGPAVEKRRDVLALGRIGGFGVRGAQRGRGHHLAVEATRERTREHVGRVVGAAIEMTRRTPTRSTPDRRAGSRRSAGSRDRRDARRARSTNRSSTSASDPRTTGRPAASAMSATASSRSSVLVATTNSSTRRSASRSSMNRSSGRPDRSWSTLPGSRVEPVRACTTHSDERPARAHRTDDLGTLLDRVGDARRRPCRRSRRRPRCRARAAGRDRRHELRATSSAAVGGCRRDDRAARRPGPTTAGAGCAPARARSPGAPSRHASSIVTPPAVTTIPAAASSSARPSGACTATTPAGTESAPHGPTTSRTSMRRERRVARRPQPRAPIPRSSAAPVVTSTRSTGRVDGREPGTRRLGTGGTSA